MKEIENIFLTCMPIISFIGLISSVFITHSNNWVIYFILTVLTSVASTLRD